MLEDSDTVVYKFEITAVIEQEMDLSFSEIQAYVVMMYCIGEKLKKHEGITLKWSDCNFNDRIYQEIRKKLTGGYTRVDYMPRELTDVLDYFRRQMILIDDLTTYQDTDDYCYSLKINGTFTRSMDEIIEHHIGRGESNVNLVSVMRYRLQSMFEFILGVTGFHDANFHTKVEVASAPRDKVLLLEEYMRRKSGAGIRRY